VGAFFVRRILTMIAVFLLNHRDHLLAGAHWRRAIRFSRLIRSTSTTPGQPAFIAQKRHDLGLDQPLIVQYFAGSVMPCRATSGTRWRAAVRSFDDQRAHQPDDRADGPLPRSRHPDRAAAGHPAAVRKNGITDYLATVVSLVTISTPTFFLGIIAIYVFSLKLHLLPSSGMSNPNDGSPADLVRH